MTALPTRSDAASSVASTVLAWLYALYDVVNERLVAGTVALKNDQIDEGTAGSGVTVDGVLLKDATVKAGAGPDISGVAATLIQANAAGDANIAVIDSTNNFEGQFGTSTTGRNHVRLGSYTAGVPVDIVMGNSAKLTVNSSGQVGINCDPATGDEMLEVVSSGGGNDSFRARDGVYSSFAIGHRSGYVDLKASGQGFSFKPDGTNEKVAIEANGQINATKDQSVDHYLGKTWLGTVGGDNMYLGHLDQAGGGGGYALYQSAVGYTQLNCGSGQGLSFKIGDSTMANFDNNKYFYLPNPGQRMVVGLSSYSGGAQIQSRNNSSNLPGLLVENTYGSWATTLVSFDLGRTSQGGGIQFIQMRSNCNGTPDSEFRVVDNGTVYSDGGTAMSSPADYAEMFEWADGNPDEEDRVGYSVALVDNQIKIAENDDEPIGIVSGNPAVVADNAWNRWADKYLRDDFNRPIYEDYEILEWTEIATNDDDQEVEQPVAYPFDAVPEGVEVPEEHTVSVSRRRKLNPDYDPEREYTPRDDRPEWDAVGLVGKLRLRKGSPIGDRWIKMRDVSAEVEEWLVR